MKGALRAEWTKLRTLPGLRLLPGAIVVATVVPGVVAVSVAVGDETRLSLVGVYLGQALVAVLGVLVIGGEYGSGLIGSTLTAVPRRLTVLAAKAVVLTGVVAGTGTVAALAGRPSGEDALRVVAYLVLVGLLSFGIATAVRDSATAIGIVLGLLYVVPIIARTVADPGWQRRLEQILPTSPWRGLGVTGGWAAAALVFGAFLFHRRDI